MPVSRRQFLASGISIIGVSSLYMNPFAKPDVIITPKYKPIYADEIDMSELPLHDKPFHCSAYPYEVPEFNDEFATSYEYLHDPEIECW